MAKVKNLIRLFFLFLIFFFFKFINIHEIFFIKIYHQEDLADIMEKLICPY
jgi:hypothetical protein